MNMDMNRRRLVAREDNPPLPEAEPNWDVWDEARAWAKTLTDTQISAALEEMRERGAAVPYYSAEEFESMFDGTLKEDFDVDGWMAEHREDLEEAMCETARAYFLARTDDAFEESEYD